jgi:tRNA pseudouridine38-40 synthase
VPEGEALPDGTFRYAAVVEYDGSEYCGWQRQPHCEGVQSVVERALSAVANEPVTVACAGRTDTGVHATNQVIHFDSTAIRRPRNWVLGSNANLPPGVRLHWAGQMTADFHARFSALTRTYRYLVLNSSTQPALLRKGLTWERSSLSVTAMKQAVSPLVGRHDFSAFRAAGCQSATPWRKIHYFDIYRVNDFVVFEICANAFLLHMVRNIMGTLLVIGREEQDVNWLGQLLVDADRTKAAMTAPASGLYLVGVAYPDKYNLPTFKPGPSFIGCDWRGS